MIHRENYFNYFTEVEEYFAQRRGRSLLVSPLDWCLIELWKESGIPLHVVLRGIDRSFESGRKRRKKEPKTLFYCHAAVMEAFEEYQQGRVGEHEEETIQPNPGELVQLREAGDFLGDLKQALASRSGDVYERALERLSHLGEELQRRQDLRLEEVDRSLGDIGSLLAEGLLEQLSGEQRKALNKQVREDLRLYRKRLSKETFQQLEKRYRQRQVRQLHGLPEFSLFEMDRVA